MKYEFTPAARRAVCHAAAWLGRNDCSESRGAALLLGLLAQGECRAAAMLARCHLTPRPSTPAGRAWLLPRRHRVVVPNHQWILYRVWKFFSMPPRPGWPIFLAPWC